MIHGNFAIGACFALVLALQARPALCVEVTVFEKLGGSAAIEHICNELVDRMVADPRGRRPFEDVRLDRLKKSLAEHLCHLTGGGCVYHGDPIPVVHAGLGITQAEFYILVEHLRGVLDDMSVTPGARNGLLALLAPFKRDVVEGRH